MNLVGMLASELVEAGIMIDRSVRILRTARIWRRGEREFERVQDEIGIDLAPFKRSCIRSLGVGAALTEFAISGIHLTREAHLAVTALGGLAILMVSAADSALDNGLQIPRLFPMDGGLESAGAASPKPSLIRSAVSLYFKRLAALPQTRPEIRAMVDTAIHRMYQAELESVSGANISRVAWWRKNTLPIAIIGIPAWMAADSCTSKHFRRHLAWLCRLGEFFGWLDDCVDYEDDLAHSHANRIDFRLQSMPQSHLVRNIVGQAKRVLSQWDAVNRATPARDYFAVIVWSWIEPKLGRASL